MSNAYFKETDGIYSCDIGLAMGSHLSAIASDFVLSTSEYVTQQNKSEENEIEKGKENNEAATDMDDDLPVNDGKFQGHNP